MTKFPLLYLYYYRSKAYTSIPLNLSRLSMQYKRCGNHSGTKGNDNDDKVKHVNTDDDQLCSRN